MDIMEIITGSNQQRATFCAPICQKKMKIKQNFCQCDQSSLICMLFIML